MQRFVKHLAPMLPTAFVPSDKTMRNWIDTSTRPWSSSLVTRLGAMLHQTSITLSGLFQTRKVQ